MSESLPNQLQGLACQDIHPARQSFPRLLMPEWACKNFELAHM